MRLRCYLQVSSFRLQTGNWYSRWKLCFNSTFNFRCSCSAPCVVFNSVATVLLPVCCPGVKPGSPIFSHFVVHQYQFLIISARKQFHYRKGLNFGIVHYKMSCGTSRIMPHFDPIWDKGSLQTYLLQISWLLQIARSRVTGWQFSWKFLLSSGVSHFQLLTALAFCR